MEMAVLLLLGPFLFRSSPFYLGLKLLQLYDVVRGLGKFLPLIYST